MDPLPVLAQLNGIARSSTLRERGVSLHFIAREVSRGNLVRPRRGWLAIPSIEPELLAAVRRGVVISCISQARRLGLWVREEDRTHVAAPSSSAHVQAYGCRVHWGTPLLPRTRDQVEDSIENVLAFVASCQPYETAHAIWESALNRRLVSLERLRKLPFRSSAARLLETSTPYSDSGLESIFHTRLRFLGVRITPQAWLHGHRVDFLIGDRLVVQIDGATHVGAQRNQDNKHDAELMLHGFHVIRLGYWQIIENWPWVQSTIMQAIAQRLHRRRGP